MMVLILGGSVFLLISGALLISHTRSLGMFFLMVGIGSVIVTLLRMKGGAA